MDDNVSKIKERLNVVDVISGYLKLQKAGVNFKAPCPFHNEKTPSFFVSPERQIWHCFGCQKGGDIFSFVKEIEGIEFPEALRTLAIRAGVELEKFDSEVKDSKEHLYQICETAARFFEKQLHQSKSGQRALQYLKDRGVSNETMIQFRLGFAPATWDSLNKYLSGAGYSEAEIVDAGLAIKRESASRNQDSGGSYDRFRSRVIFPIADVNGRVVGFTGRIFDDENQTNDKQPTTNNDKSSVVSRQSSVDVAKYINTPQTLIYDKSRTLYGLNHSRGEIRRNNKCLLVEGNMDAVMSYQAGVKNVVASSGTALTSAHLNILKRYTANLDFCFDTDSAGTLATRRGIGMSLAQDFNVKVISLDDPEGQANPEGEQAPYGAGGAGKECKDPADYVKKYGQEWQKIVDAAKPAIEFYFDRAKETYDSNSPESKKHFILTIAPFIKRLSSRVERAHWVNQLAFLLRTKESDVESDVMSVPDDLNIYESQSPNLQNLSKLKPEVKINLPDDLNMANNWLLSIIIRNPALFVREINSFDEQFLGSFAAKVITELKSNNLEEFNFNNFINKFDQEEASGLDIIHLQSHKDWNEFKDDDLKIILTNMLKSLKEKTIKRSLLPDLIYEIGVAESTKDEARKADLVIKYGELTQELNKIFKV